MVLVLFFIVIFITIILISKLKITINEIELSNEIENTPLIKEFSLSIGIYVFNRFKIFNKNVNKGDLQKVKSSKKLQILKSKFMNKDTLKEKKQNMRKDIDVLKKLNLNLQEIELQVNLGTEDVILTSFLICIISIIISMILSKAIKKYNEKKHKYKIIPNYNNKNSINIRLNGIIDIKLVNIISILFKLWFRSDEFDKRTSNRRAYANSHEQYPRNDRCKYNYRGTN